jgi:hypothetical protein
MIIFIIYARCRPMKVNLLRINRFFMQDEKKKLLSQSTHHAVSNIPNVYRVAPKSVSGQF